MVGTTFWRDLRYSRTYTTTVELDGSPYAVDLISIPESAAKKAGIGSATSRLEVRGRPTRTLYADQAIQPTDLVAIVSLLLVDGLVPVADNLEALVQVGLEVAQRDPEIRRLADSVVNEQLLLVERSPARKVALGAAVAAFGTIAIVDAGTAMVVLISIGSAGLVVIRRSEGLQNKVDDVVDPLEANIARVRDLQRRGEISSEEADRQVAALVDGWVEKRRRR